MRTCCPAWREELDQAKLGLDWCTQRRSYLRHDVARLQRYDCRWQRQPVRRENLGHAGLGTPEAYAGRSRACGHQQLASTDVRAPGGDWLRRSRMPQRRAHAQAAELAQRRRWV